MDNSSFFSMDKLVEFGMGMAVAKQMAESMNASLAQMPIPGAGIVKDLNDDKVYFVAIDGKAEGPYSLTEMARLVGAGRIHKETYVWKPGMDSWDLAENVDGLLRLIALTPPPIPEK